MAHITISVEYGIHCLLWLVGDEVTLSSRELAELQGISPSFLAKIFPKLEKAGLVTASEGARGGYRLGRPAERISLLDIVDAIEGPKPLFDCQGVRERCVLFNDVAPDWATAGPCSIHAAMLSAEQAMRDSLAKQTLADIAAKVVRKTSSDVIDKLDAWMGERRRHRSRPPRDHPS